MKEFNIITQAIEYITLNSKKNISLEDIANHVQLSPTYFQKMFTKWAGVSPKQFQRFLSLEYAKTLLNENQTTYSTSLDTGLSSGGRLHDLFVDIIAVTPGEFKNGGQGLDICYSIHDSNFGSYLVASTTKGVCNVLFVDDNNPLQLLQARWPNANLVNIQHELHQPLIDFFDNRKTDKKIKLHLNGTNFQLHVWAALLSIPDGKISTYGTIAKTIGEQSPLASRAVGTAIGDNPVGYIIPCHRVLKSTGQISGYRWGVSRKQAILGYEASHKTSHKNYD